eukprot:CAMPEP_0181224010 /NCGR_PEP_ID=MMETSP1096-20121128/30875_1 /TAXON_ID=156174 ORGANISM="Chrysochromulina ericina, Strain CCMP281" /NCGR_SAMPLE_ID=MMETSP1096 /ASSEMBLY_ACC=CAM_ASM_000453 /LENGTH=42 /DNA_ID= /DNA_START= /DNA_END= /DNA_ORIENTATION=
MAHTSWDESRRTNALSLLLSVVPSGPVVPHGPVVPPHGPIVW